MKDFKFIDLFAGIGGLRIPFDELGGQCIFSSEIDKFARKTYKDNFSEEPSGDITQIKAEDIPPFDVLLAGFPCQAFSSFGQRKGFEDTRGTLFFDVARILEYHQPKAFLLENVKNLKHHDKGNTFRVIHETLEELGYDIHTEVINSKDYVPQNRERIYIIGFKDQVDFKFPESPKNRLYELKDVIKNQLDEKIIERYTLRNTIWNWLQVKKNNKNNNFSYNILDLNKDEYTKTITADYHNNGSDALVPQIGKNPRKMIIEELLMLQGFPRNFNIKASYYQACRQVGNSVSVPVIRAIANEMIKYI